MAKSVGVIANHQVVILVAPSSVVDLNGNKKIKMNWLHFEHHRNDHVINATPAKLPRVRFTKPKR